MSWLMPKLASHLLVAVTLDRAQHERPPLHLRHGRHARERVAHRAPALDLGFAARAGCRDTLGIVET